MGPQGATMLIWASGGSRSPPKPKHAVRYVQRLRVHSIPGPPFLEPPLEGLFDRGTGRLWGGNSFRGQGPH